MIKLDNPEEILEIILRAATNSKFAVINGKEDMAFHFFGLIGYIEGVSSAISQHEIEVRDKKFAAEAFLEKARAE